MRAKETQAQTILRLLKERGELTNVEMNRMGIYRYAARIQELRKLGHDISSVHEKGGLWRFIYTSWNHPDFGPDVQVGIDLEKGSDKSVIVVHEDDISDGVIAAELLFAPIKADQASLRTSASTGPDGEISVSLENVREPEQIGLELGNLLPPRQKRFI
jgi:Helix-turn-helix domain